METTYSQLETAFILSAFAYLSTDNLLKQIQNTFSGQETLQFIATPSPYDNYAFITYNQQLNRYTLAIRGSVPFSAPNWGGFYNWISEDFNVFQQSNWPYPTDTSNPTLQVSNGSLLALTQLLSLQDSPTASDNDPQSPIYTLLSQAAGQGSQILITGHSLGANMANSFAVYFAQQLQQAGQSITNVSLISIAAPASGNQAFAAMLDADYPGQQSFHYELAGDIVPKFPVVDQILDKLMVLYGSLSSSGDVPEAASIEVYPPYSPTLANAFEVVAGAIALSYWLEDTNAYSQPTNNYEMQSQPAPSSFPNTITGFFQEAKMFHSLYAYSEAYAPSISQLIKQVSSLVPAYRNVLLA
ncbi:lipase family protein [Spirosoma validum]|uniref:Fungal lipase-type domain-containing protein n=1 Tax=Spirosoma validum TaxID=2771355 RepID=A0A927GCC9_9BACT|nr:hypothetical protein [Spirosoma validum]MBD2752632.1 hypothetical protein [Spirosoma validum]